MLRPGASDTFDETTAQWVLGGIQTRLPLGESLDATPVSLS